MTKLHSKNENRVTIKDVALAAGVSVTTVSNLLNGRMYAMAEETRKRIEQAIFSLDYRPSQVARSLVTNHTVTIGLILSEIETPLFLIAAKLIEQIAREAGYGVLIVNANSTDDEQQVIRLLTEKQADGIIFFSTSTYFKDDFLDKLPTSTPPIVLVNRTTQMKRFDQVNWDNSAGIIQAVDYLAKMGHRRIAHLKGPLNRHSTDERVQGYRLGLEKNGLTYDEAYVRSGDFTASSESWYQSTLELLSLPTPPTAIIAADDIVAATVLRAVHSVGLHVPEDISVMGIDDQPFFCEYLNPALTTVQLPFLEAGKLAIHLLLGSMTGSRKKVEHVTLPCPLVLRKSCGPTQDASRYA